MDTTQITEARASELVFQAIVAMKNENRSASRVRIRDMTGLPMSKVDENVKRLADDGKIVRVVAGVYEPNEIWPAPRAITVTETTEGLFIFENGDQVFQVSPPELRKMYFKMKGHIDNFNMAEEVRQLYAIQSAQQGQINHLKAQNRALVKRTTHRPDPRQPGLWEVNSGKKARA